MLSRSMREALEGKAIVDKLAAPTERGGTTRRPFGGNQLCPRCGWPCSQLQVDERGDLAGPLYEHRSHPASGGEHVWPQLHTCEPGPDDCPFCMDCADC